MFDVCAVGRAALPGGQDGTICCPPDVVHAKAQRDLARFGGVCPREEPEERLAAPCRDIEPGAHRRRSPARWHRPPRWPGIFHPPGGGVPLPPAPFCSPAIIFSREAASMPRARKLVAINPPSGNPFTELSPTESGRDGTAPQPIQVSAGVADRA